MPVTKRFVLVLVVVLVLEFVGTARWDIALRSHSSSTRGQVPIVDRSVTPFPRLIEDEDDDEDEYDSRWLPNIPDLLQGISTLI